MPHLPLGGRASGPLGSAGARVTLMHQVALPAQDGFRSRQQPQSAQHQAGRGSEKGDEEGPVFGCELHPVSAELPLQDGDLTAQRQNLHVLAPVTHRQ